MSWVKLWVRLTAPEAPRKSPEAPQYTFSWSRGSSRCAVHHCTSRDPHPLGEYRAIELGAFVNLPQLVDVHIFAERSVQLVGDAENIRRIELLAADHDKVDIGATVRLLPRVRAEQNDTLRMVFSQDGQDFLDKLFPAVNVSDIFSPPALFDLCKNFRAVIKDTPDARVLMR